MLDNTDFIETDIPFEVPLPEQPYMPVRTIEHCVTFCREMDLINTHALSYTLALCLHTCAYYLTSL